MKVLHCADVHLDSNMLTHLSVQKAKERNLELLDNFQQMIEFGEQHNVKAILIAGDLFDTSTPAESAKKAFLKMVKEHNRIFFFYLRGNHDRDVNFQGELPPNLLRFDQRWQYYACGNVTIAGVECEGANLEQVEELRLMEEKVNIVMLHGTTAEHCDRGSEDDQIPLGRIRNHNVDYLALGHYHGYRKDYLDSRGKVVYSGCLEGRGYDECGQKGFVMLDIDEEKLDIKSRFVPFGKRQLFDVAVNVQGCMTSIEMARNIQAQLDAIDAEAEDMVKVRLLGSLDVECEKSLRYLSNKFVGQYYNFKLEDQTVIYVDYSDFVIDETLKGEFVRMVHQAEDIPQDEKADIIRYGILALAGEELAE